MKILGVDPGKKGGFALLQNGKPIELLPMVVAGKDLDLEYIASWIIDAGPIDLCVMEKVGAMPKQGVVSMFTFGKVTGAIYGILATLKIPYRLVTPQTWKKIVLDGTDRSKEASLDHVKRLYPELDLRATSQSRKPHEGIIDALCIAEYGWRIFGELLKMR